MRRCCFAAMMLGMFSLSSRACLGPENISGVAFTSGETVDIGVLEQMGIENVNFYKEGDGAKVGIRYRSHYDSRAIVFIGNYGMSYQEDLPMACMGVIFPLADSESVYEQIDTSVFNFTKAVVTELQWMKYYGVINMTDEEINRFDSTCKNGSMNGGVQYWTHVKHLLGYNSWYDYDTVLGTWRGTDEGVNGVDGVYGVQGVKGLDGCSVIHPGVDAPEEGLGSSTAVSPKSTTLPIARQPLSIRYLGNGGMIVFLPLPSKAGSVLAIIDCKGAIVTKKQLTSGMKSIMVNGLAQGRYHARVIER